MRPARTPATFTSAPVNPAWDWVWAGIGVAAVIAALAWRFLKS